MSPERTPAPAPDAVSASPPRLPPVRRAHLVELRAFGPIAQHAIGTRPDPDHGSCTDDVARALEVDLLHGGVIGWEAVEGAAWEGLRYLDEAVDERSGRFRNFRSVEGEWQERVGSEDAHGRAMLALGRAMATAPDRSFRVAAAGVFRRALPGTVGLTALRARSSALIGCALASSGDQATEVRAAWLAVGARLAASLADEVEPVAASPDWRWPEPVLTYEAALVPRALILAGRWTAERRLTDAGLAVLDWLSRTATTADGHLSPVGNLGWWPRGSARARFDQQPIEAAAFVHAAEAALDLTSDPRYLEDAERALGWFLGRNDLGVAVADAARGGCRDGLQADGCNENQGAESTLAWLAAVERLRVIRGRWSAAAPRRSSGGVVLPRSDAAPAWGSPARTR
jgi:hypothetical protein